MKLISIFSGLLLVLFLFFTRFYQLNTLPASLIHDEIIYSVEAKAYALTGEGIFGQKPWSLQPFHPMFAELPATIMTPGFWITDNGLLASHFMPAILGVLLPFIFGALLWGIWRNRTLAILGIIIAACNPLLWQFSRMNLDAIFSVFFYLGAAAVYANTQSWKRLLSIPLLVLGFFQYQGLKLILVPWIGTIFLLDIITSISRDSSPITISAIKNKISIFNSIVLGSALMLTIFYGFVLLPQQNASSRLDRTIFSDHTEIAKLVDTERRLTLTNPLLPVFSNKFTLAGQHMIKRLFSSLDPFLLFVQGEPTASGFAVWTHGIFYLIDAVLIIVGGYYLFTSRGNHWTGFILISGSISFAAANLINTANQWHMMRTFMTYVALLVFISWGAYFAWQRSITRWILITGYVISVGVFTYHYFYRYPVTHLDAGTFDERIVLHYAQLTRGLTDKPIIIYTDTPDMVFYNYLVYENMMTPERIPKIKTLVAENEQQNYERYVLGQKTTSSYTLENVTITNNCVTIEQSDAIIIWRSNHSFCGDPKDTEHIAQRRLFTKDHLTVPAVLDSGEDFQIHGDQVCNDFELSQFAFLKQYHQLDLANLSTQEFCQNWITDLQVLQPSTAL